MVGLFRAFIELLRRAFKTTWEQLGEVVVWAVMIGAGTLLVMQTLTWAKWPIPAWPLVALGVWFTLNLLYAMDDERAN